MVILRSQGDEESLVISLRFFASLRMTDLLRGNFNSLLQCNMNIAKKISLLLLLVPLFGCANQLQRPNPSQTIAEKEPQEQKKETEPPTFTYRPGG